MTSFVIKKMIPFIMCLALAVTLIMPFEDASAATKPYLAKTKTNVNYRTGPSTSYKKKGSLKKGTYVTFVSTKNGWGKTAKGNYVCLRYTQKTSYSKCVPFKAAALENLNIRKGPGTSYAKNGKYLKSSTFDILSVNGNWGKTSSGYVCLDFIRYVKSSTLPLSLKAPTVSVASPGYRRMDVSWKPVTGAQGYYVYEYDVTNETEKTIKLDSSYTSYSFYEKEKGSQFQYKVMAFANVGTKVIKSDWSSLKSGTAAGTLVGQARNDENGNIRGGKAGDQTGKEVMASSWSYNAKDGKWNNWQYVARFKDSAKAAKAAKAMRDACDNENIGYDQGSRTQLYGYAKAVNWDLTKVDKPCECSCSPLVSVCINATGISTPKGWSTSNSSMLKALKETRQFVILTEKKYTSNDAYLQSGDILVSPGKHTGMVL